MEICFKSVFITSYHKRGPREVIRGHAVNRQVGKIRLMFWYDDANWHLTWVIHMLGLTSSWATFYSCHSSRWSVVVTWRDFACPAISGPPQSKGRLRWCQLLLNVTRSRKGCQYGEKGEPIFKKVVSEVLNTELKEWEKESMRVGSS